MSCRVSGCHHGEDARAPAAQRTVAAGGSLPRAPPTRQLGTSRDRRGRHHLCRPHNARGGQAHEQCACRVPRGRSTSGSRSPRQPSQSRRSVRRAAGASTMAMGVPGTPFRRTANSRPLSRAATSSAGRSARHRLPTVPLVDKDHLEILRAETFLLRGEGRLDRSRHIREESAETTRPSVTVVQLHQQGNGSVSKGLAAHPGVRTLSNLFHTPPAGGRRARRRNVHAGWRTPACSGGGGHERRRPLYLGLIGGPDARTRRGK